MKGKEISKILISLGFSEYKLLKIAPTLINKYLEKLINQPITPPQAKELKKTFNKEKLLIIVLYPYSISNLDIKQINNQSTLSQLTASFAKINYYQAIVKNLRTVVSLIKETSSLTKSDFRIFSNSTLPEKQLALMSGLVETGKNNLLISPHTGSAFLVGGIIFPLEALKSPLLVNHDITAPKPDISPPGTLCGNCHLCQQACPTQALTDKNIFEKLKCLQYYSNQEISPPSQQYPLFYGCQYCQEVCPYFKEHPLAASNRTRAAQITDNNLLEKITIEMLLSQPEAHAIEFLEKQLKKTALGQKWISKKALYQNLLELQNQINFLKSD